MRSTISELQWPRKTIWNAYGKVMASVARSKDDRGKRAGISITKAKHGMQTSTIHSNHSMEKSKRSVYIKVRIAAD